MPAGRLGRVPEEKSSDTTAPGGWGAVGGCPQDPVAQDPVAQDPVAQDPVAQDPVAQDPVAQDQSCRRSACRPSGRPTLASVGRRDDREGHLGHALPGFAGEAGEPFEVVLSEAQVLGDRARRRCPRAGIFTGSRRRLDRACALLCVELWVGARGAHGCGPGRVGRSGGGPWGLRWPPRQGVGDRLRRCGREAHAPRLREVLQERSLTRLEDEGQVDPAGGPR